ncbi:MAG: PH domain-containing protein [bacterium]|nr:PH domain-containing protein [bacterium]
MNIDHFIHRKSYENKLHILRSHAFTFLPTIILFIVLALVPVAVYFLIINIFPSFVTGPVARPLLILLASVYYLSILLFFYSYFVDFYLDVTIVTNDRMVDIEQVSLFGRTVSEVDLYQIQDATSEVKGFFPSIFNYGKVTIQTAGTVPKFIMHDIPRPHDVRQMLLDFASVDKQFHSGQK